MVSLRVRSAIEHIGRDIQIARKRRRMSIQDFADRVGVSPASIMRLEAGDPGVRIETFIAALHVLGRLRELQAIIAPGPDTTPLPRRINRPRHSSDEGEGF